MKTKRFIQLATLIFLFILVIILTALITKTRVSKSGSINIIDSKLINWGIGWKNHQSSYSGSELRFSFENSKRISIKVLSPLPEPDQGIEISLEGKTYLLSSPNLNKKELTIYLDKNSNLKPQTARLRFFCAYQYYPCNITLESITMDGSTKLLPPPNLPDKIFSIFGDSISSNFGLQNYSFPLSDNLGYQLHNASMFNSTLTPNSNGRDVQRRYEEDIQSYKPNIVLFFIGTNDVAEKESLDNFEKYYKSILTSVKQNIPGVKIATTGILNRKDIDPGLIVNYNSVIKKVSESENVMFIDTQGWLSDNDYMDSIHPSLAGQQKLTSHFLKILSSIK